MPTDMLFRGAAPALVTPFTADGELDESAFRALIETQIDGGVDALVVLGTTGENPTVTHEERRQLVDWAVDAAHGRVPVIVGTGTNSTAQSITFSQEAEQAGADGLLVVGPYYNKPSQDNFVAHTAAIAEATALPIVLYNVPGRTSFNITAETALRIAQEVPQVVGVKEASGDLQQITDILAHRPSGFAVYAGDDEMALPVTLLGGDGVVSVISNALPDAFASLAHAALAGEVASAQKQHFALLEAMRACFYATNPVPVKTVLAATGTISEHVRLPMQPLDPESAVRRRVLDAFAPHIDIL
ncbi:4-hydroxy-tetrahydrodipicolinate synthase [Longimonas halophila]|uniref:4-hydroxy-tetrahydrodipicolinate synthase n=1 Tax=Longimonas halophila TaxID=1469170 RepID=A0A2H3P625_9BACT|nr:4-hydroxy-tetrahydrodipicolinate synthase [Longimonas halophila]PEN07702.1 4-hydroxy-tetrahydrodipicolinate synthase [Longimonas halophila]